MNDPNIVFMMADDMGWGDVGCNNPESLIPTPYIDAIADEGIRFTDAHSPCALCTPTRYGLLTGRYYWRTPKKHALVMPYEAPVIEPERPTLATMLRNQGYATACVGKWHLGLLYPDRDGIYTENEADIDFTRPLRGGPIELGFDYFFGTAGCSTSDAPYCFIENDQTVGIPSRHSTEELHKLPGFYPGLMVSDWSEPDRAGHLTAKGVIEAIRSTRPGVMEYQLDAVMLYHYLAGGAKDRGYHAIIAGGENAFYGHYCENNCQLNDGDIVLVDCAPDYRYYTSDIGRMWPVNGIYSKAQQAIYGFVVEYHKVLLDFIRPGRMVADIHQEAAEKMGDVLSNWNFATPAHKAAAKAMFDFRGHISHCVALTVHDGGLHYSRPLEPGMVFSVDPQFRLPEEKLYYRVEDTIVITNDGIENLTVEAPLELDHVEALMKDEGLLQAFAEN